MVTLISGTTLEQRKSVSPAEVAQKVFREKYPNVLCILGRGIERQEIIRDGASTLQEDWRATPMFEHMPGRCHSGIGRLELDLSAPDVRYGGGNVSLQATSILLEGLAEIGKLPSYVLFAAGRPNYMNNKDAAGNPLDPSGEMNEGVVMAQKVFGRLDMISKRKGLGLEGITPRLDDYKKSPEDSPMYLLNENSKISIAVAPYNTNSEDDIRAGLELAAMITEGTARKGVLRLMTAGVHVPRCAIFLNELAHEKAGWLDLNAEFMSADNVLGLYRPGVYKKVFRDLENVPAYMRTATDENKGAMKRIDHDYVTVQPHEFFKRRKAYE